MINRNKKIIMILSTIFTVVLAISFTYAFFYYGKEGSTITLEAGSISINFEEDVNYLTLHDTYPKSDEVGQISTNYYDFTVSGSKGAYDDILYEIQIEQLDGNTLAEQYVNVYLTDQEDSELGSRVKNLTDLPTSKYNGNRVIYSDYIYSENQVEDYRLRVWVDDSYTENVQNTFNFKVVLYAVNDEMVTLYDAVEETLAPYLLEKDGDGEWDARIVSGSKDDENLKNYVWYSGKLWRIVALNNNGTIKMVTTDNITTISWGANTTYEGSWMYQWLNEDFKDTLYNYKNLLVTDYKWNATETATADKPANTTMVSGTVGLLNYYEYVKSYSKTSYGSGYLNNGYYWWLITPYSSSNVRCVHNIGNAISSYPSGAYGACPSINLKSNIQIASGDGSKEKPYQIKGDINEPSEDELLHERVSGEYVNFDNELYRIVSIENKITKITKVDYIREDDTAVTKSFSSGIKYGTGTTSSYWDHYLNNDWYNAISANYRGMIVTSDWYLGTVGSTTSENYKNSICKATNAIETTKYCERTDVIYNNYVGLGRIGEMFTSQIGDGYNTSSTIWTITPYNSSYVRLVYSSSGSTYSDNPSYAYGARPSINLSSDIRIVGGLGTESSPFEIVKG